MEKSLWKTKVNFLLDKHPHLSEMCIADVSVAEKEEEGHTIYINKIHNYYNKEILLEDIPDSIKDKIESSALYLFNKECDDSGADEGRVAPMLLPDYTDPRIREKQLTSHYVGTMR